MCIISLIKNSIYVHQRIFNPLSRRPAGDRIFILFINNSINGTGLLFNLLMIVKNYCGTVLDFRGQVLLSNPLENNFKLLNLIL